MPDGLHVLPVRIDDVWIALEAAAVEEVLGATHWVPLPGAIPAVPGVIPWRGQAIAVVDIALLVGIAAPLAGGEVRPRALVAQSDGMRFAMPVDAVREVHHVEAEAVGPARTTKVRLARAEIDLEGQLMPVVDLAAAIALITGKEAEVA
jgi:purine-binding chemotaxis protein CheW